MAVNEIKQELTRKGENPDDYDIEVTEKGHTVTPKWFYETKHIAKKEDKPIIEDVNAVAELTTLTSVDKDEIAEMLVFALSRIDELEAKMNG